MIVAALLMLTAAPVQERAVDCSNPAFQPDMNLCAFQEHERADAAMNAQWKITAAEMKERDRALDPSEDMGPGRYQTLLVRQRAWVIDRDLQCKSDGNFARGSAEAMLVGQCLTRLTKERTEQLKALIEEN